MSAVAASAGHREEVRLPGWAVDLFIAVALAAGGLLTIEVLFPAWRGETARPPAGVLATGVVEGCLYALTAVALILVYRSSRIINFAQVAIGSAAGLFLTQMNVGYRVDVRAMLLPSLLVALLGGVLAELALRRFARAPRLLVTVATITLAPAATLVMGQIVSSLNPLPATARQAATTLRTIDVPFPELHFRIDPIVFGFKDVATVGGAALGLLGVGLFLWLTRYGRAVRASADNPEAAGLLGINTRLLTTAVWAMAALLSGIASVCSLLLHGIDIAGRDGGTTALLPALAAAMIAGFESIPLAAFAAVWMYVMLQATQWAYPNATFLEPALLVIIVAALVLRRRTLQRRQRAEAGLWEAVRGLRPAPTVLRALPGVRRARSLILLLCAAGAIVFPQIASPAQIQGGVTTLLFVMVLVSLLMVVGWLGQINLGQYALVAVGAFVTAGMMTRPGLSFWLALPTACLVGGAVAVLLGLAALRVQGLWLAPVTLVVAASAPVILFSEPWFGWLAPRGSLERPSLPLVDLSDEKTFYYSMLAAAVGVILVAVRFRRSRLGEVVVALRDNEAAAQAAGIDPLRSRIATLALSGVIAGFAGALLAVQQGAVDAVNFGADQSLNLFVMLILGGLGGVSGAVIGAVFGGVVLHVWRDLAPLITGVGALGILLLLPGGLSGGLFAVRDAVLRLIAVRRNLDVPSLMGASEPPTALDRWRLAQPDSGAGLAALPTTQRYARPSFLWGRPRS